MQIRNRRVALSWMIAVLSIAVVVVAIVVLARSGGPVLGQSLAIGYTDMQRALESHPRKAASERALQEFFHAKQLEFQQRSKTMTPAQRQELDQKLQQDFIQRRTELLKGLDQDIRATIEKVARAQGISIVLDRNVVLFGGTDLTPLVIKELAGK